MSEETGADALEAPQQAREAQEAQEAQEALEALDGPEKAQAQADEADGSEGAEEAPYGSDGGDEPGDEAGDEPGDEPEDDGGLGAPTLESALEALLLVTDVPLDIPTLAAAVRRPTAEVEQSVRALADEYTGQGRGFDLRESAGGWRYYTRADCSVVVERFVRDGQQARLTQAALETLAVVAYRQPVSRARISAVRGVNVDGVIRTLTTRGLIEEAGHDPTSQAILYRTTELFLERLGLTALDQLPPIADYLPDIELLDALADEL